MLILRLLAIAVILLPKAVTAGTCDWRYESREIGNRTVKQLCKSTCLLAPNLCPNTYVKFYLHKNGDKNGQEIQVDGTGGITGGLVTSGSQVKIIIHGYKGNYKGHPTFEIIKNYLQSEKYNVISVDYSPFCDANCYATCVNNLRCAANCTGQIIEALVKKTGFEKTDIHVIGFAEGAIVAAQIHNYITVGKLSRITALDPTYSRFIPQPLKIDQLDAKHADFVDVIHTNIGWKGVTDPYGHIDFYVNGGFTQPSCTNKGTSCDHEMAAIYFAESIISQDGFWAHECICRSQPSKPRKIEKQSDYPDNIYYSSSSLISSRTIDPKFTGKCENSTSDKCIYKFIKSLRCKNQWSDYALINQCASIPNPTSDFFVKMGEHVDQTARGVYLLFTNSKAPYGRSKQESSP